MSDPSGMVAWIVPGIVADVSGDQVWVECSDCAGAGFTNGSWDRDAEDFARCEGGGGYLADETDEPH